MLVWLVGASRSKSGNSFFIGSPLLLRKLHLACLFRLLYVGAINLNLLKLLYVAVNLVYMYLATVIFVEYFEHGLILLLVDVKVIGCHYSSSSH